jgi:hypothetical protein
MNFIARYFTRTARADGYSEAAEMAETTADYLGYPVDHPVRLLAHAYRLQAFYIDARDVARKNPELDLSKTS